MAVVLAPQERACLFPSSDAALAQIAAHFHVLSVPMRLQLLQWLSERERTVGELANLCSCSVANASRHLSLLARYGLVEREMRGHCAWYRLEDASWEVLCDGVCAHITRHFQRLSSGRPFPPGELA